MKSSEFTKEEIKALKELAQERMFFEKCFSYDEDGKKIPRGNHSDFVKAMRGKK